MLNQTAASSRPLNPLLMSTLGFMLTLIGFGGVVGATWQAIEAYASTTWPAVSGKIVLSEVKITHDRKLRKHYDITVKYEYQVSSFWHTSDKLSFGDGWSYGSEAAAVAALGAYPVGDEVQVYYNPDHPATAVLKRGATWLSLLLPVVMLIMPAMGAALLWKYLIKRPDMESEDLLDASE
jgi:hypothetical protein